jgi:hypothetical protein
MGPHTVKSGGNFVTPDVSGYDDKKDMVFSNKNSDDVSVVRSMAENEENASRSLKNFYDDLNTGVVSKKWKISMANEESNLNEDKFDREKPYCASDSCSARMSFAKEPLGKVSISFVH